MVSTEMLHPRQNFLEHYGVEPTREHFEIAASGFSVGFNSGAFMRESWRKRNTLAASRMDVVRGEILHEEAFARGHAERMLGNLYVDESSSGFPYDMQRVLHGKNAVPILAALERQKTELLHQAILGAAQTLETVDISKFYEEGELEKMGNLERLDLQWLIRSHFTYITLQELDDERQDLSISRYYSLQYLLSIL